MAFNPITVYDAISAWGHCSAVSFVMHYILLLVSDRNTRERISDESVQVSVCYRENNKQWQGGVHLRRSRSDSKHPSLSLADSPNRLRLCHSRSICSLHSFFSSVSIALLSLSRTQHRSKARCLLSHWGSISFTAACTIWSVVGRTKILHSQRASGV